ncbi:MAG: hypothetical protein LBM65_01485 [Oscillospiraceae bacterium]|jgi:hypothetical protein|nr:hypothetical protein [Oscillospiraceae bacterium]
MSKKVLSIVLCLCLVVSVFAALPLTAFAASTVTSLRYEYNGQGKYENMFDMLEETLNYPYQLKKFGNNHSAIV